RAAAAGILRLPAAIGVPAIAGADIAADLETDVSARDVVEPLTVEGADLHVFDRLGLDGKIGSLRPRHCDKPCRTADETTLHHLHSNLQVALHGRVPSPPGVRPNGRSPSVPSSVQIPAKPLQPETRNLAT